MSGIEPNPEQIEKIKAPVSLPVDMRSKCISKEERKYYQGQTHGLEQDIEERAKYSLRMFVLLRFSRFWLHKA